VLVWERSLCTEAARIISSERAGNESATIDEIMRFAPHNKETTSTTTILSEFEQESRQVTGGVVEASVCCYMIGARDKNTGKLHNSIRARTHAKRSNSISPKIKFPIERNWNRRKKAARVCIGNLTVEWRATTNYSKREKHGAKNSKDVCFGRGREQRAQKKIQFEPQLSVRRLAIIYL
jgi:hypothetical protein